MASEMPVLKDTSAPPALAMQAFAKGHTPSALSPLLWGDAHLSLPSYCSFPLLSFFSLAAEQEEKLVPLVSASPRALCRLPSLSPSCSLPTAALMVKTPSLLLGLGPPEHQPSPHQLQLFIGNYPKVPQTPHIQTKLLLSLKSGPVLLLYFPSQLQAPSLTQLSGSEA